MTNDNSAAGSESSCKRLLDAPCSQDRFLNDVADHQMTVLHDNGVYRHVRFGRPGSSNMAFSIITWPGYLCYAGDMGSFVFMRLHDMFEFFRTDARHQAARGDDLVINLGYWAEKVQAADRDGIKQYDAEKFERLVKEWLVEREASAEVMAAAEDEVLAYANDGEIDARSAASDFEHDGRRYFDDFGEVDLTSYTFRFVWCCYALAWAVRKYDEASNPAFEPTAARGGPPVGSKGNVGPGE